MNGWMNKNDTEVQTYTLMCLCVNTYVIFVSDALSSCVFRVSSIYLCQIDTTLSVLHVCHEHFL